MSVEKSTLENFYRAFGERDHATLTSLYSDQAVFSDPVFPRLEGKNIGAMWHMLLERGRDISIEVHEIQAQKKTATARFTAHYTFSLTGRKVDNTIQSEFTFRDGLIQTQVDQFDFWKWTRMALGPLGIVLGWSNLIQNKVRGNAKENLRNFITEHPEYLNDAQQGFPPEA